MRGELKEKSIIPTYESTQEKKHCLLVLVVNKIIKITHKNDKMSSYDHLTDCDKMAICFLI